MSLVASADWSSENSGGGGGSNGDFSAHFSQVSQATDSPLPGRVVPSKLVPAPTSFVFCQCRVCLLIASLPLLPRHVECLEKWNVLDKGEEYALVDRRGFRKLLLNPRLCMSEYEPKITPIPLSHYFFVGLQQDGSPGEPRDKTRPSIPRPAWLGPSSSWRRWCSPAWSAGPRPAKGGRSPAGTPHASRWRSS